MPNPKPVRTKKKTIQEIHLQKVTEMQRIRTQIKDRLKIQSDNTFYDMVFGRKVLNDGEKIIIAEAYGVDVSEVKWLEKNDRII